MVWYIPPAGKTVRFSLVMLLCITDGKIIEKRFHIDVHNILRQLGTNA
ncbi:ester cyclase [Domibacillus robiginosus]